MEAKTDLIKMFGYGLSLNEIISIVSIFIALASISLVIYDRKLRLSIVHYSNPDLDSLVLFNNYSKRVNISQYKIFASHFRYFTKKEYAFIPYFEGGDVSILGIQPYEYKVVEFKEENSISEFLRKHKSENIYITISYNGKKKRTYRIIKPKRNWFI